MSIDTQEKESFLQELYRTSGGMAESQVSMYQLGDNLGLSRSEVSALSEDLIIDGYVELRTLSGAVSITAEGLAALGIASETDLSATLPQLSGENILTDDDRQLLADIITKTKQCTFGASTPLAQLEDLLIELKTLELQLQAAQPKSAIAVAVLTSMTERLLPLQNSEAASSLRTDLEHLIRTERNSSTAG